MMTNKPNGANLGFEPQLWATPNALCGSMEAADYKQVVLWPISLDYLSDAFDGHWFRLQKSTREPTIGKLVDDALAAPAWRLAKVNIAIRGIQGKIEEGDSFPNDRLPDIKAGYILFNPPFNMKRRGGEQWRLACLSLGAGREDRRSKFGDANFGSVQERIEKGVAT